MNSLDQRIVATYRLHCTADEAESLARAVAVEQSIEMDEGIVHDARLLEQVVGRVEAIEHNGHTAIATISFDPLLADGQLGQLLNLAFGSVSLYPGVRLLDLAVPDKVARLIGGPEFGIQGIREAVGVSHRALLCGVLKPRGTAIPDLARLAGDLARGGADLIKDDQNLAEANLETFKSRVSACYAAIQKAKSDSGGRCLYLPHVSGAGPDLHQRLEFLRNNGFKAVLMCPWIMGLEHCKALARQYGLIYMAHPVMAGCYTRPAEHGIAAPVLYGLLTRLGAADCSLFPGTSGRISVSDQQYQQITEQLVSPLANLLSSMPASGGGHTLETILKTGSTDSPDRIVVVGGGLQVTPDSVADTTRQYHNALSRG